MHRSSYDINFKVIRCSKLTPIDKLRWDDWVAFNGWKVGKTDNEQLGLASSLKRPRELSSKRLIHCSVDATFVFGSRGSYEVMAVDVILGKD